MKHLYEELFFHKVGAGASCQVPTTGKKLHSFKVNFLITTDSIFYSATGFSERRRVENNEIVFTRFFICKFAEQIEHVCLQPFNNFIKTIDFCIVVCHAYCFRTDVDSSNLGCTALCSIEGKATGVGEAVQNLFAFSNFSNSLAIVLLVEEETCLLSIFHINSVTDTVFVDFSSSGAFRVKQVRFKEAFIFFHTFQTTNLHIVTFVQATDILSHFMHNLYQQVKEHFLTHFNTQRKSLSYENIIEAVNGKSGESICFAKNKTAAVKIFLAHYGQTIVQCVTQATFPESFVKFIISISRNNAHSDFRHVIYKTGANIFTFMSYNINKVAILVFALNFGYFFTKYPRVTGASHLFSFRSYKKSCVVAHNSNLFRF